MSKKDNKNHNKKNTSKGNNEKSPKKKNIVLMIVGKNKNNLEEKKDENEIKKNNSPKKEKIEEFEFDENEDEEFEFDEDLEEEDDENDEDYIDDEEEEYDLDDFIVDDDLFDEEEEMRLEEQRRQVEEERKERKRIEEKKRMEEKRKKEEDKRNNSKKRNLEEDLNDEDIGFLNIIIGGRGPGGPFMHEPLKNKRDGPLKKRSKKQENFFDYFKDKKDLIPIKEKIETLQDLIKLGESYDEKDENRYVINMKALNKCVPALQELDAFIGMKNIKKMIIDLIFFRLQNFEENIKDEMWHLVIQGSPGCGKTEISKVIGKLYYGLGIVENDSFTQVKRSQLIGKYLGHTAVQTQEIFDKAEGGVLFIDEAYSLGNPEGRDNFSKECIDTINQNLTEKKNTVVIIAGYKDQLNESFFNYNPGLARRFKMRMNIDSYDHKDLRQIYLKKIKENKWHIFDDNEEKEIPIQFFEKNREIFKFNGGDMENLWSLTKIAHARRVFGKSNTIIKKITKEDLENGLKLYQENDEVKNRDKELKKYLLNTMYC